MKGKYLLFFLLVFSLVSCSEYQKVLKSTDYELKWKKANEYYEQKKYTRSIELLEELQPLHKGTERAEQTLFMLANSYFNKKDYYSSATYFETYFKTYPKGTFAEDCRFLAGKAAYLNSPDARLTQEETYKAIDLLNVFMDYYPESDHKEEVTRMLTDLQDKLVYKQYLACKLYFDLGDYMGNNYQSCIITAGNALMDYPVSKYRENIALLVVKSKYMMALKSVDEMKIERYRSALDEANAFKNEFPDGKNVKEAEGIIKDCKKIIKD